MPDAKRKRLSESEQLLFRFLCLLDVPQEQALSMVTDCLSRRLASPTHRGLQTQAADQASFRLGSAALDAGP